jgi:hypothetical protein
MTLSDLAVLSLVSVCVTIGVATFLSCMFDLRKAGKFNDD